MDTEMRILETGKDYLLVVLEGRLDAMGVGCVEEDFLTLVRKGKKSVLVDFAQVPFISSMGMRMLLDAARSAAKKKHKVIIVGPNKLVANALRMASLHRCTPVAASREEAEVLLGS